MLDATMTAIRDSRSPVDTVLDIALVSREVEDQMFANAKTPEEAAKISAYWREFRLDLTAIFNGFVRTKRDGVAELVD